MTRNNPLQETAAPDANMLLALNLIQQGKFQEAKQAIQHALKLHANHPDALSNLALCENQLGEFELALQHGLQALKIAPTHQYAPINVANALASLKKFQEAENTLTNYLTTYPQHPEALHNLGLIQLTLGKHTNAATCFKQADASLPNTPQIKLNWALSLRHLGKHDQCEKLALQTIGLIPNNPQAWYLLGLAQRALGKKSDSINSLRIAVQLDPHYQEARIEKAGVHVELKDYVSAAQTLNEAPEKTAEIWLALGTLDAQKRDWSAALCAYEKSIALQPINPPAFFNLGKLFSTTKKVDAAIAAYEKSIQFDPNFAESYNNLSYCYSELGQYDKSVELLANAIRLNESLPFAKGARLFNRLRICDWTNYQRDIEDIEQGINKGEKVANPFLLVAISDSPELQKRCAEIYAANKSIITKTYQTKASKRQKTRIAYFSADFHAHATSYLFANVLSVHDQQVFDIYLFSYGPATDDALQNKIRKNCKQFFDVSALADESIIDKARKLDLDIAIDLKGYTKDSRPEIFLSRVAPIQINFLGFPGTLGSSAFDYIIADEFIVPEHTRRYYTERVLYTDNCYQPNDSTRIRPLPKKSKSDYKLIEGHFVFASFNNNYKISPKICLAWISILKNCPNSLLWILVDNSSAQNNLTKFFMSNGISEDRIVFAKKTEFEEHLGRHQYADILLDTYPCSAHTTASDALFMGLPIVTLAGSTFASRVCGSLLSSLGCEDLVLNDIDSYIQMAVSLYRDESRLSHYRALLSERKLKESLFNTRSFTSNLESIFLQIATRRQMDMQNKYE